MTAWVRHVAGEKRVVTFECPPFADPQEGYLLRGSPEELAALAAAEEERKRRFPKKRGRRKDG